MYTLLYYQHTVKSILENRLVFRISKHDKKKVCTQALWLIKPQLTHPFLSKVASGNLLGLLSRHFQRVSCLKFTDDGSHFLSSGDDNLVMVWKMAK